MSVHRHILFCLSEERRKKRFRPFFFDPLTQNWIFTLFDIGINSKINRVLTIVMCRLFRMISHAEATLLVMCGVAFECMLVCWRFIACSLYLFSFCHLTLNAYLLCNSLLFFLLLSLSSFSVLLLLSIHILWFYEYDVVDNMRIAHIGMCYACEFSWYINAFSQ